MVKNSRFYLVLLFFAFFFRLNANIIAGKDDSLSIEPKERFNPPFLSADSVWVDSVLKTLSIEEKIAQLLMVAAYSGRDESHFLEIEQLIEKYHIGGLIFFQGGPVRQAALTNRFQKASRIPLLVAMDGEWGLGMRLDSTLSYPRQMTLGAISDDSLIYRMGYDIGNQYKRIGIHVNFAPVADVNNNPRNPVINNRSFGEDPLNVARKAAMYADGLRDAGIIATAKHFPGHGDTDMDSHFSLPLIPHSTERLDSVELFPFRYLIDNGIQAIMTAHLSIPSLDTTRGLASSLSPDVISELLRNKMQFQGLIITDALNMKGVSHYFKPGDAELMAFIAGNDILLMPGDIPKAIASIRREIKRGTISETELDSRCRKVLLAKAWCGLDHYAPAELKKIKADLDSPAYRVLKRKLVAASITLVKNENNLLPLLPLEDLSIASISIGNGLPDPFALSLRLYTEVNTFYINKDASQSQFDSLNSIIKNYNTLIISLQETSPWPGRKFGLSERTLRFLENLDFEGNAILVNFGSPYSLDRIRKPETFQSILIANEDQELFKELAAQALFGALPVNGKLPVGSGTICKAGDGISYSSLNRLSYGIPEEVGMNSETLSSIDSLAKTCTVMKASPGCQILVARHGKVVYHKAFGFKTYRNDEPVSLEDIYDIASLTKITSTIPSLMLLYDRKLFSIRDTLGNYLDLEDTSRIARLRILDILTHQAGFQPWIPFYYKVVQTLDTSETLFSTRYSDTYSVKIAKNSYANRNIVLIDSLFSMNYSNRFPVMVAKNLYLREDYRDTIFNSILHSDINPSQGYRYSDLGYYLFHFIIENLTGKNLYPFVYEEFYSKIGANSLGYLPLNRFPVSRIVPTENDIIFRKQLLRGYVHDPGAAMLGGIAGHAGIFSNSNDLAKMMQLYLNGGDYGGRIFLTDSTVQRFTACYNCINGNRRGLGFDKPEPDPKKPGPSSRLASSSSYGHSGFTGTLAWIDPEYDLIYIFLSNRIHPDQYNQKLIESDLRTKIQDVIYQSVIQK